MLKITVKWSLLLACLSLGCGGLRNGSVGGGSGGLGMTGGDAGKGGRSASGGAAGAGVGGAGPAAGSGGTVPGTAGATGASSTGGATTVGSGGGGQPGAPGGMPGVGGHGATSAGGAAATGAPGGSTGTGGIVATGGIVGPGGMSGSGGVIGTGGTLACQGSATQCMGAKIQTCSNGQWGAAASCPMRQECTGPAGAAMCTCTTDVVCSSSQVGNRCNAGAVVTCAQDSGGCYYQSMSTPCGGHQTCAGSPGQARCECVVDPVCSSAGTFCATSTSIGMCQQDGTCLYQGPASPCGTGTVCERVSPALCADPNWAAWPIPAATNVTTYTDNGDGTVSDQVTGLMWQKAVGGMMAFSTASSYCGGLTLGGQTGWRVPTKIELMSIIDYGRTNPSINTTVFPATPAQFFASTTWSIYFLDGTTYVLDTSSSFYVRCVR